jgi:UDP-N-acetylmuramyl tripeptide synthase
MFRARIAIALGRLARRLSRLLGRGGTAVPGLVAARIDPGLLEHLVAGVPVVVVTGTNGKTTTTRMLVAALQHAGWSVATNPSGSNLARGVLTSLIEHSRRGTLDADVAVLEIDEAAVRELGGRLRPAMLVVTNLHRDQLDRYGELATTASHVGAAAAASETVVLNSDDPMVAGLAASAAGAVAWFGGSEAVRALMPHDAMLHAGDRPGPAVATPDAVVTGAEPDGEGQRVSLVVDGARIEVSLAVPGVYNAFNAAAALLAAARLGVEPPDGAAAIEGMPPAFGRGQVIERRGRRVRLLLVKNPAGLNHAIRLVAGIAQPSQVVVAINDRDADGRDVSWLWDAAVEELSGAGHGYGASGIRAADMALRFKYAGIDAWVEPDLEKAVDRAVDATPEGGTVQVVPTYTAMLELLEVLQPGVPRSEAWS